MFQYVFGRVVTTRSKFFLSAMTQNKAHVPNSTWVDGWNFRDADSGLVFLGWKSITGGFQTYFPAKNGFQMEKSDEVQQKVIFKSM